MFLKLALELSLIFTKESKLQIAGKIDIDICSSHLHLSMVLPIHITYCWFSKSYSPYVPN
jgi:hypothetical protein